MMHWSAAFLGIPWADKGRTRDGADCWGVVRLALQERAGVVVPSYDGLYASADEQAEIAAIVRREAASPLWLPVEGEPRELDVVFFRQGAHASHAGLAVSPWLMLHSAAQDQSKIQPFRPAPAGMRLTGIYRWHELECRA